MISSNLHANKNVLIVDDDQSITEMLSLLLERRGYGVEVASSGQEVFQTVSPSTDLILLDLVLQDDDGFNVCRKLKQNTDTKHIPIIILSGRILSKDIIEGLYLGADDYLTKPFEYEELVARMEAVMRRGVYFKQQSSEDNNQAELIQEIRKIIEEKLLVPFYQPI
ncbi:MAG: response regulator transcription factor, partial [Candidatus Omnitrophica bacterium]|nr:response regulator transcription factor [Candidatus Omnitrophota bacterium]